MRSSAVGPDRAAGRSSARRQLGVLLGAGASMMLPQVVNEATHTSDAKAFIAWLDSQPSVAKNRKIGVHGYCMGDAEKAWTRLLALYGKALA